jgi:hypothetical protein
MQVFYALSDNCGSDYPFFVKPSPNFFQWLFIYLTIPVSFVTSLAYWESHKPDINCIKKHKAHMDGKYNSALSTLISMKKAKEVAKSMGITFNDLILGMTSKSLKQHFVKCGDPQTEITLTLPFTFNSIPKDHTKYKYGNDFIALPLYLKLEMDFAKACEDAKRKMNQMKNSLLPGGFYMLVWWYTACLPAAFTANVLFDSGKKHTICLSNVPGFTKPVTYGDGGVCTRFFSLISGPGNCATAISVVSINKRCQIAFMSDTSQIKDVDAFADLFNVQIKELGIDYKANEEGSD